MQMLGLLSLMLGSYPALAQFTFLTDNRSTGSSTFTNGVFVNGQTNSPSATFADFSSNPGSGLAFAGGGSINGSASQSSQLRSNSIMMTNFVGLNYSFPTPPVPFASVYGVDAFDITFSVQTPTRINLSGYVANNDNPFAPLGPVTLTSVHHGTIVTGPSIPSLSTSNWVYSGILQPDTYELTENANIQYTSQQGLGSGFWETGVSIVAVPSPQITSTVFTNNTVQLTVSAPAGSTNRVLTTTNIANPLSQWQPISTNVVGISGVFHVTNSIPAGRNTGFYMISSP